ncbi:MAG: hypothetical protein AAF334_02580 [Pseudomonadota bacterium]
MAVVVRTLKEFLEAILEALGSKPASIRIPVRVRNDRRVPRRR